MRDIEQAPIYMGPDTVVSRGLVPTSHVRTMNGVRKHQVGEVEVILGMGARGSLSKDGALNGIGLVGNTGMTRGGIGHRIAASDPPVGGPDAGASVVDAGLATNRLATDR